MPKKLTTEDFIKKANQVHNNKYNYSKVIYINSRTKVCIICPIHGKFWQTPHTHLYGSECLFCSKIIKSEKIGNKKRKTIERLEYEFKNIHGDKYNYSLVSKNNYQNAKSKIPIICKKHGIFYQIATNHKSGNGCPKCKSSKGEKEIEQWLLFQNIKFIHQYKFLNCKNKNLLSFDFYLPNYNTCIEYDGEQHFKPTGFGENSNKKLKRTQINDKIKNEYCRENNIRLIRIPYWEKKNITKLLTASFIDTPSLHINTQIHC